MQNKYWLKNMSHTSKQTNGDLKVGLAGKTHELDPQMRNAGGKPPAVVVALSCLVGSLLRPTLQAATQVQQ